MNDAKRREIIKKLNEPIEVKLARALGITVEEFRKIRREDITVDGKPL